MVTEIPSPAQDAIGPFISTVGTTVQEPGNGRNWAYLLWTANAPTLLSGRAHAIYSKAGDANAANPFTRVAIVSRRNSKGGVTQAEAGKGSG